MSLGSILKRLTDDCYIIVIWKEKVVYHGNVGNCTLSEDFQVEKIVFNYDEVFIELNSSYKSYS